MRYQFLGCNISAILQHITTHHFQIKTKIIECEEEDVEASMKTPPTRHESDVC